MRIDHLSLQNFRCFEQLELDFHPHCHVLIGRNGSGKTAILEALASGVGRWFQGIGGFETHSIRRDDVRLVGHRIGDAMTFEQQYPVQIDARGRINDELFYSIRLLKAGQTLVFTKNRVDLRKLAEDAGDKVRQGELVVLPLIVYFGAGRLWQSAPESRKPLQQPDLSRLQGYHNALSARNSAQDLHRWLEYQDRIAYQERVESSLYRAALDAMCAMLPDAIDVRFDPKRLEAVVIFRNDVIRPFRLLSDGQRNMLAMAGDIAVRMARLNPQFGPEVLKETPGLVLIDELDLHLHPEWQRNIIHNLSRTFPKVQFIATTHSPQVISELKPEQITILEDGEHIARPFQSYGMDSNFILRHLMHVTDRPAEITERLQEIELLIKQEEYETAEKRIDALRAEVGEFAELVRLQTRIDRTRLLSK